MKKKKGEAQKNKEQPKNFSRSFSGCLLLLQYLQYLTRLFTLFLNR